jgi:hypothetical protein
MRAMSNHIGYRVRREAEGDGGFCLSHRAFRELRTLGQPEALDARRVKI